MPEIDDLQDAVPVFTPLLVTLAIVALVFAGAHWLFQARASKAGTRSNFGRPIVMLTFVAIGVVAIIIALPLRDAVKDQLLGLFGLAMTGIIGLSSTTFVSNAMAGFMIRSIGSFRSGDFVRVGNHFGRVSARGLFHTEIQTEERDLTTLPNLYLVTNPVSVVRSSGTIVSATISLGYDTHQATVEPLLIEAALLTGLEEPFVHVLELGDFSVSYRIAGLLPEVKQLVTKRSQLRINAMNTLHEAGVEILSPSAMMQRPLKDGVRIVPPVRHAPATMEENVSIPEERIFDKAEEAEELERIEFERKRLTEEKKQLQGRASSLEGEELESTQQDIQSLEVAIDKIDAQQDALEDRKE